MLVDVRIPVGKQFANQFEIQNLYAGMSTIVKSSLCRQSSWFQKTFHTASFPRPFQEALRMMEKGAGCPGSAETVLGESKCFCTSCLHCIPMKVLATVPPSLESCRKCQEQVLSVLLPAGNHCQPSEKTETT